MSCVESAQYLKAVSKKALPSRKNVLLWSLKILGQQRKKVWRKLFLPRQSKIKLSHWRWSKRKSLITLNSRVIIHRRCSTRYAVSGGTKKPQTDDRVVLPTAKEGAQQQIERLVDGVETSSDMIPPTVKRRKECSL